MREINSRYAKTHLEIVIEFSTNTWAFHFRDTWYLQTQLHPRVFYVYCLLISPFVRFLNICFLKKLSSRRCLIFFFYILNVCKCNICQKIFYVPYTPAKHHLPLLARDFSLFTLFTSDIVSVRIKKFARKIPRQNIIRYTSSCYSNAFRLFRCLSRINPSILQCFLKLCILLNAVV